MAEAADFAALLRALMARKLRTNTDLARLAGISVNTIENWTSGEVRRPRFVVDILKLAEALTLDAQETNALLAAAGHPALQRLQQQAQKTGDTRLSALVARWIQGAGSSDTGAEAAPLLIARHQLRPPVADFAGRDAEVEQLVTTLRAALGQGCGAVISGVQGMGGIGKTELAYAAADRLRDAFPDAQIVLNLRGASATPLTAEQALQQVIHVFTPDAKLPERVEALEQHYRTVLHGQRALILADDAGDAAQMTSLIPPSSSALLITSRQRFSLPGMTSIDLEQLGDDQAVTLLRGICPRLSQAEAQAIAHACGHLPLALRISGGILRNDPALDVSTYLQRVTDERQRLKQLRDPDDPRLDVAAVLARSYALLDAQTQRVFCQLGVFVTDFATSLAQAAVEVPADGDVEATLHLLLRRNLLMYDAERSRWRLHDLLRDLARRELDAAGEREAMMWRYARAAVAIAQETQDQYVASGEDALAALARFDAERAHIDLARHWAAMHAGTSEGDTLLVQDGQATRFIGDLRYDLRHERIPQMEGACAAAQRLGDRHGEALVLNNLGNAYADLGEAQRAIPYYEQCLTIACELGDRHLEGSSLGNLGLAYANLGDARRAIPYHEQWLAIARELGDRRGEGRTLSNLGNAYGDLGDVQRAISSYEPALATFRELGDRRSEALVLNNLGDAYRILGDVRRAISSYEPALATFRELGDRRGEAQVLDNLGVAYTDLGDAQQAIENGECSLAIVRVLDDRRSEGYVLCHLARAQALQGNRGYATTAFAEAVALLKAVGDRWGIADSQWQFGLTLVHQGDRGQALPLLHAAVAYEQEIGHIKAAEHATLLARLEAGEELPPELLHPANQRAVGHDEDIAADTTQP